MTNLFVKITWKIFEELLEKQELRDLISCVLLMHMRNSSHNILMMVAAVVVMRYHQIQQQDY